MSTEILSPPQSDLSQMYLQVRSHTEKLCEPLQIEDYIPQPAAFVSPPKWHLAHTSWFFETFLLLPHLPGYKVYHEDFSFLFNSYYNAVGNRVFRADRGNITRPGVKEVYTYRAHVNDHMQQLLDRVDLSEELLDLVILGLQHEQQHQELLITDLKYILAHNPIFPVYKEGFSLVNQVESPQHYSQISEGVYDIGFDGRGFHFDNELGRHKYYIHDFEIRRSLVTNGEYLAFMEDKGYHRADLWLDEGWSWKETNQITSPLYWYLIDGQWHQYTLSGLMIVDPAAVLGHVSFYEAAAFADWAGGRLPTEFEWEVASHTFSWGLRWEWTNSAYLPYPGFKKARGALGEYNGKFMVNQKVLRGGSAATSPRHSRKTYRNFFHPPFGWQYTGIRLVK